MPSTGTPATRARRAISAGTFPRGVWKSIAPLAVITRSAAAMRSSSACGSRSPSRSTSKRGASRAPSTAARPAPRPPEAPVPPPVRTSIAGPCGLCSSSREAHRSSAAASCSTCSGVAPFCGPNTRATPLGPHSTLWMLQASTISTSPMRGWRPERSRRAASSRWRPPACTSSPAESRMRAPSACSAPAPPSLVPESPHPTMIRSAPPSRAATMSSPTPRVVVSPGSRRSRGTSRSPAADAISTTAVPFALPPSRAQCAATGAPTGPVTVTGTSSPPVAAASAAAVPSPPSGTGNSSTWTPGMTRRTPAAIACATTSALRLSLNPLGATRMRCGIWMDMIPPSAPGRALGRPDGRRVRPTAGATITGGPDGARGTG